MLYKNKHVSVIYGNVKHEIHPRATNRAGIACAKCEIRSRNFTRNLSDRYRPSAMRLNDVLFAVLWLP